MMLLFTGTYNIQGVTLLSNDKNGTSCFQCIFLPNSNINGCLLNLIPINSSLGSCSMSRNITLSKTNCSLSEMCLDNLYNGGYTIEIYDIYNATNDTALSYSDQPQVLTNIDIDGVQCSNNSSGIILKTFNNFTVHVVCVTMSIGHYSFNSKFYLSLIQVLIHPLQVSSIYSPTATTCSFPIVCFRSILSTCEHVGDNYSYMIMYSLISLYISNTITLFSLVYNINLFGLFPTVVTVTSTIDETSSTAIPTQSDKAFENNGELFIILNVIIT